MGVKHPLPGLSFTTRTPPEHHQMVDRLHSDFEITFFIRIGSVDTHISCRRQGTIIPPLKGFPDSLVVLLLVLDR